MLSVKVKPDFSNRLNHASAKKRCYPWDTRVIDWTVPIDNQHLYMPETFSVAYDTPAWTRINFECKSYITRYEFTQNMRNAGVGEHILIQALMSLLRHIDQYDPAWRYLLHEVAEECQHMAMFNAWIKINPDIRTKGLMDDKWSLVASGLTPVLAINFPTLLWSLTLMLELVGDTFQRLQHKEPGQLHPIVTQIARAHELEEARHIAFAQEWLRETTPRLGRFQRRSLAVIVENVAEAVLRIGLNPPYSRQLAPHISAREFKQGIRSAQRKAIMQEALRPTILSMLELGIIRTTTVTRWRKNGVIVIAL